jgi:hypothetical protein
MIVIEKNRVLLVVRIMLPPLNTDLDRDAKPI